MINILRLELRGFCIPFIESFKRWSAFASHTQNKQQEPKNVDLSAPTSLAPIRLLNVAWAFFNWYYNCSYIFSLYYFSISIVPSEGSIFYFLPDQFCQISRFHLFSFSFWSPEVSIRNVSFIFLRAGSYPSMKNGREMY